VFACRVLALKWCVTAKRSLGNGNKHHVFRSMFSEKAVSTSSEMACTEYQVRTFLETAAPTPPRPSVSPDLFICVYRPTRLRSCVFVPCRLVGKYEQFRATYCLDVLPLMMSVPPKRFYYQSIRGTRWRGWLRHCATIRKVAGSISDGVTGIFH